MQALIFTAGSLVIAGLAIFIVKNTQVSYD